MSIIDELNEIQKKEQAKRLSKFKTEQQKAKKTKKKNRLKDIASANADLSNHLDVIKRYAALSPHKKCANIGLGYKRREAYINRVIANLENEGFDIKLCSGRRYGGDLGYHLEVKWS